MTDVKTDVSIEIDTNGPYHVIGRVPVVRVEKVTNDEKVNTGWNVYDELGTEDEWWLCRCGHSTDKPHCTGMHEKVGFDGTETAATDRYADRAKALGGTGTVVKDDRAICAHASYCTNRITNVWKAAKTIDDDAELREAVIKMVQNCPSGALTLEIDGVTSEAETPMRIAVQKDGPLLVQGGIRVKRADGQEMEIRNRIALCRCGNSENKPLCDGSHAESGFTDG